MIPKIKVHLYLKADSFDLAEVTKRLSINPTEAREKTQFPQVSIDMGIACTRWKYTTTEKESLSVSDSMKELIDVFGSKVEVINELINEFQLKTRVVVVINGELVRLPEMYINKESIAFAASINASIGFDLYLD